MRRMVALALLMVLCAQPVLASREHYEAVADDVASYQLTFTDISDVAWAHPAITALAAQGVVSGVDAWSFAPHREVTKKESLKLLVGVLGVMNEDAKSSFSDLTAEDWSYPYVASAVLCGMIADGGVLDGDKPITRGELAQIAANGMAAIGFDVKVTDKEPLFTDPQPIPDGAYYLRDIGVIRGDGDGTFRPDDTCTRAEATQIIYGLREYIKSEWMKG